MDEPLLCRRCNKPRETEFWAFCGACAAANNAYRAKEHKQSREMSRYTDRLTGTGKTGLSKSRKKSDASRLPVEFVHDEEPHYTEQNARTNYHGDNYVDE